MNRTFHTITALLALQAQNIQAVTVDAEASDYAGLQFGYGKGTFIFRQAKITPKKAGAFVTFWKRDAQQQTVPYQDSDDFDYYMILIQEGEQLGLFLFPKQVLIAQKYVSSAHREGKRGFRIYPPALQNLNTQASKTQRWQSAYYYDLHTDDRLHVAKVFAQLLD